MRVFLLLALLPALAGASDFPDEWMYGIAGRAAVAAPFAGTGCQASGATVGHSAPLTTTRATQETYCASSGCATIATCANNEAAVSTSGLDVYAAGTNLLAASTMSDQGNAAWVKSNVTVSADAGVAPDGTTTADRLTATAGGSPATSIQTVTGAGLASRSVSLWFQAGTQGTTASVALLTDGAAPTCTNITPTATPARYSVSASSTPVTNTALAIYLTANCTGNATAGDNVLVWGGQHEVGAYPTPFTTSTRNATVSTVPLPALGTNWCVGVTGTPGGGRAWGTTPATTIIAGGTAGAANSFALYTSGGLLIGSVFNSTPLQKYVTATPPAVAGSTHRLVFCGAAGTLSIYLDGTKVSGAPAGAGDGVLSAAPTPGYVGAGAGQAAFDGSLRDLRVYPNATYRSGM